MQAPRIIVLAALAASLASCAKSGDIPSHADRSSQPPSARATMNDLTGNWTLTTINASPAPAYPGDADPIGFTLTDDGALSGYTGVNRMSGRLDAASVPKGEFRVGPIATTRRAGPPERMKLESDFTAALDLAARFALAGDTLTLFPASKDAPPLMTLSRRR